MGPNRPPPPSAPRLLSSSDAHRRRFTPASYAAAMWSLEFSRRTTASPERIWAWYQDHESAPEWDPLVGRIQPDGPIAVGVTGRNTPRTGPSVPFVYTEVTPLASYTEVSRVPGGSMAFTHDLRHDGDETVVTHGVRCEGPMSTVYRLVLRPSYKRGMAKALDGLIRLAEQGPPPVREV